MLVLGPDAATHPDRDDPTPLTRLLARELVKDGVPDAPADGRDDLAVAAQLFLSGSEQDRFDLELAVQRFYEPFKERTTPVHRDLATVPFELCLTTTVDPFLANAFVEAGKAPFRGFYDFVNPVASQAPTEASPERPVVFSLFGSLEQLESLVLCQTEVIDFLEAIARGNSGLPPFITARLADPQVSFLFVGFGFQRWYSPILLYMLKALNHRSRSIALESEAFFQHPDHARVAVFFERTQSIEFRRHSLHEFAAGLRTRCESASQQARERPVSEPPPGAPRVFLCHDSRDRPRVAELEQQLHALGVDTWRDQQELRGGDGWDRRIRQVIGKQVDYVVVLETPHMLERAESYVHVEIAEARQRQQRFDVNERFLIPATLEANAGLERLDDLHRASLQTTPDVERFAADLLADWQRRRSRRPGVAA